MEFRLLGHVKAYTNNNDEVTLSDRQSRLMLAMLLLAEGPISIEETSERLWDGEDNQPLNPKDRVYHVKRELHVALTNAESGSTGVLQRNGFYQIEVSRSHVDVFRFRDLAKDARALARKDDLQAVSLWRTAIAEWGPYLPGRGLYGPTPLAGLRGMRTGYIRDTLQSEHRTALIGCLNAELRLGRHVQLIPELEALANANDASAQDEELATLLMLAYYRSKRRSAALKTFHQLCDILKEIGLSPTRDLRSLHSQILKEDPALDLQKGTTMPSADTDDMQSASDEISEENTDEAEQEATGATPDAKQPRKERLRGQLFGDVNHFGPNARSYQAETQIFREHPEDT